MSVGIILLCHASLDRAAQVARFWADAGSPVVVHVDKRVAASEVAQMQSALADLPIVSFCERHVCEWGMFGLVAATLAAARQMIDRHPEARHVYLASGACLPLRPHAELVDYLAAYPDTDFIESVTTRDVSWIVGGLEAERFTLRFPFSFRRQRTLFDGYVRLQHRLGFRRAIPAGLEPHLGSQWWCLTARTLKAILDDPRRAEYDRYFRRSWIPDESYFQTLARVHSPRVESRSLTLSKFDLLGRPHMFYDDHLQLLRRSDCFVARKIWPRADRLYRHFLGPAPATAERAEPNPAKIDRLFAAALDRQMRGRAGLYMQSRFPAAPRPGDMTAAPYSVFHGFTDLFEDFAPWLARFAGCRVHGHLFAPEEVEFAGDEVIYNGGLSSSAALRDYDARGFLTSLVWTTRGERQIFQYGPRDEQSCYPFIAADPNARIAAISGSWTLGLLRSGMDFPMARAEAARLQKIEMATLRLLRAPELRARVRLWTLAEFLEEPQENLQLVLDEMMPHEPRALREVPRMFAFDGLAEFLQALKNCGMLPTTAGQFSLVHELRMSARGGERR